MKLSSKPLGLIVVVIVFGGILVSMALGAWNTESNKEAAKFSAGEFAGLANPADIRGSYTLADIEKNFGISPRILAEAFSIQSADPAAFQVKQLETQYAGSPVEIGTSSVRLFVAFYKNLPFDLTTDVYLPPAAVAFLKQMPLSAQQNAYLESHAATEVPAGAPATIEPTAPVIPTPTPGNVSVSQTEKVVKGLTTFDELLSWGFPRQDLERILGFSLPTDLTMKIKDFASANNVDFETLKIDLQKAVDVLK
jgi:hypothetical protein